MSTLSLRLNDLAKEFSFKAKIWTQDSLILSLSIYQYISLNIELISQESTTAKILTENQRAFIHDTR